MRHELSPALPCRRVPAGAAVTLASRFFRWHRWLAWLVALQVLAWVAGGVAFAWLPFKAWVKAEDSVAKPALTLPEDWAAQLARRLAAQPLPPLTSVHTVATAAGPALRLRHAGGEVWLDALGRELPALNAPSIGRFARSLYLGDGALAEVLRLAEVPPRLLIVREAAGRRDVWRASFDDGLKTRLYFDGAYGELVAVRNDAWVLYDFFWRLHVMDYGEGEDFNHGLIRTAALAALALVGVLAMLALRRRLHARRSRRSRRKLDAMRAAGERLP